MVSIQKSKLISNTLLLGLGATCLLFILDLQSDRTQKILQNTLDRENYSKIEESEKLRLYFYKKMPSFGFDNLVANWSLLQFLQYFGDYNAREKTGYTLSADYLEVITKNDPQFALAYMVISPASSLFGGTPERTVELMDEGLEYLSPDMPYAHFVWLYKGMDEILFFGDLEKAKQSYEKAAEWAKIAGDDKIYKSANDTLQFLETNPDTTQAQVGAWFHLWVNNEKPNIRQIAKENIEKLGGELKVYPDGRVEAIPPKDSKS